MTSRERKKLKVADARTIAVQPAASASGSGGIQSSGNALAGPSSTTIRFDYLKCSYAGITRVNRCGEPGSIDVEKFTDLPSLKVIKTAGLGARVLGHLTSDVFRRVHLRLREKARAEMDPVKRCILGRGQQLKRGKAKQLNRTESLLKRQRQ
ncbi:hypothetical protein AZE42_11254 [Rhizopogon vesiculosus]|uniref:Uncharacterized protein n=1 Tax=Rhizopogon vesiculosus TaxID=180088 RepID=A0A1J8QL50_9AGAM|nr:hypothetical protein AZE42_11254 [Rhizopogon vesiculosus]